jgi:hypothetical protein
LPYATRIPTEELNVDIRDVLIDGISQLTDWLDDGLKDLTPAQVNWLPEGKAVSIGFDVWHVARTTDNITNFVFKKNPPIWMTQGFAARLGLSERDQGTGMSLEMARALVISDPAVLREYSRKVGDDCLAYLKDVDPASLNEIQLIKPLGEMPRWRVFRQVVMTHGFMHLGEVNALKGIQGLQFGI